MNGILFKPDMHQATRDLRKTVTRRLDGLKEINKEPNSWYNPFKHFDGSIGFHYLTNVGQITYIKPRYHVGETVFIREAHYRYGHWVKNGISITGRLKWRFKALKKGVEVRFLDNPPSLICKYKSETGYFKRSPLHLPARFARDFILIKDDRAERLQEITEDDPFKEGIDTENEQYCLAENHMNAGVNVVPAIYAYSCLWDSINPNFPFSTNPWVIRYAFQLKQEG